MGRILAISSMVVNYIPVSTGSAGRRYAALGHVIESAVVCHSMLKREVKLLTYVLGFYTQYVINQRGVQFRSSYTAPVDPYHCHAVFSLKLKLIADSFHTKLT